MDFAIFQPKDLPLLDENVLDYGLISITNLAKIFNLPTEDTLKNWQQLLTAVINSDEFIQYRNGDANFFWGKMLANDNLPWNFNIEKLIQIGLIIPVGTADAERGFSILKHSRYDRRQG